MYNAYILRNTFSKNEWQGISLISCTKYSWYSEYSNHECDSIFMLYFWVEKDESTKSIKFPVVSKVATNHNHNTYEFPTSKHHCVNKYCYFSELLY